MNLNDLMKNLNLGNLQNQMKDVQERMKQLHASGSSGGGMVDIEMNGMLEITKMKIDPAALEDGDVSMLEDLVQAAINSLLSNWKEQVKQETSGLPFSGGLG